MNRIVITTIGALVFCGVAAVTFAADQQEMKVEQPMSNRQRRDCGPPPEAYLACKGKSAGAIAEMVTPHGEALVGICEEDRDGSLALRPESADAYPKGKRHDPPLEAYTACAGKRSGDRSQLTTPKGEKLTGSCEEDHAGKLVLRPDRHNGGRKQR